MKEVNKKYIIVTVVSLLILGVGVSLAYWTASIVGSGNPMEFRAANLKIVFDNKGEAIGEGVIEPGWSQTKTFSVKNDSGTEYTYNIILKDLINTFKTEGYLQYKITSTNGFNMTDYQDIPKSETPSNQVIGENITITGNTTQEYTIEIIYRTTDEDQSMDMGATLQGTIFIEEYRPKTLYDVILADHPTVNTRTDFDAVFGNATATTGVIYKESTYREDTTTSSANNKDVYYFAGNVADNWVKFAGYYWRIIRTNEDGGIRLLYHGTSTTATDSYIATSYAYNPTYNNTMYVGYMYGSTGSIGNNRNNTTSPQIKTKLESWYSSDIASYDNAVSKTAIYCNDRSGDAYASSGTMYYAASKRLIDNKRPTYKCGGSGASTNLYGDANAADRFSKSTTSGGNGQLSQPIGLMTADEVSFAGGVYGTTSPYAYYYLNSSGGSSTESYWWWTMSPSRFDGGGYAHVFVVSANNPGRPGGSHVSAADSTGGAVRPVLSLKSCVTVSSGNGTADSPYEIEVNDTCSAAEN